MVQLFDSALRYRKRKDDRMVIDDNEKKPRFGYDIKLLNTYKDPDKTFCPKCGFEANLLSNKHNTWYDCKRCKKAKRSEQRHIAKF
jgi:hypothetical protein